ncbi:MAG: outer membrane beta-barrel protein [Flavobacteriales bacterium]|nr:outer membrane beta-barrel protein [Flavobacteriales bacterium]
MKKLLLFSVLFSALFNAEAQRSTEYQIRAGLGLAGYAATSEFQYYFLGNNVRMKDNDGAATFHFPVELRYEVSDRFNAGIDMKFGSYLYSDTTDNTGKSNKFSIIGIGAEVSLVTAEKGRVYIGAGFNSGNLSIHDFAGGLGQETKWRGPGYRFNLGGIAYIYNGPVGVNFNIGYDKHTFDLKEYQLDGNLQNISNLIGTLTVSGIDVNLGLVFRIRS